MKSNDDDQNRDLSKVKKPQKNEKQDESKMGPETKLLPQEMERLTQRAREAALAITPQEWLESPKPNEEFPSSTQLPQESKELQKKDPNVDEGINFGRYSRSTAQEMEDLQRAKKAAETGRDEKDK